MESEKEYEFNQDKFDRISAANFNVSNLDFYTKLLKIGVSEYVKYLNRFNVAFLNISNSTESFAKNRDGVWIPNNSFILKCIEYAKIHKEYRQIDFFKSNIVLDRLSNELGSGGAFGFGMSFYLQDKRILDKAVTKRRSKNKQAKKSRRKNRK